MARQRSATDKVLYWVVMVAIGGVAVAAYGVAALAMLWHIGRFLVCVYEQCPLVMTKPFQINLLLATLAYLPLAIVVGLLVKRFCPRRDRGGPW